MKDICTHNTLNDNPPDLTNWKITALLDDIIMVAYADSNEDGHIKRGSIYINPETSRATWRVGKVLLKGPDVPEFINEGDYVQFPNDRGIVSTINNGDQVVFLNADRIFGVVQPV